MCRHSGYPLSLLLSKPLSSEPFRPPSFVQIITKLEPHWPLPLTSCVGWEFRWAWWRGCCFPWARNTQLLPENMQQVFIHIYYSCFTVLPTALTLSDAPDHTLFFPIPDLAGTAQAQPVWGSLGSRQSSVLSQFSQWNFDPLAGLKVMYSLRT